MLTVSMVPAAAPAPRDCSPVLRRGTDPGSWVGVGGQERPGSAANPPVPGSAEAQGRGVRAMDTSRTRAVAFFASCFALLLFGLAWARFPYVRSLLGPNARLFDGLIVFAVCYLALRAYLMLVRHLPAAWEYIWLAVDLGVITLAVYLTGGVRSDAAIVYFWPVATSAIQRRPRRTLCVGLACVLAYAAVCWARTLTPDQVAKLGTRLFVVIIATGVAVVYARTEAARVEELARLREQVALGDYRSRLSQEMHDGIQYYLVAIATRLDLARALAVDDPEAAARMAVEQRLTVQQAADELRYLVRRLRSPLIERRGFVDALRDHLGLFQDRTGIVPQFAIEGAVQPLRPDVEQAAFRIVQEALTNIEKHAQATAVEVHVTFGEGTLRCIVADNGHGFDASAGPSEPTTEGGFGVSSMSQRAASLDGELTIESSPDAGTRVTLTVPLEEAARPREGEHAPHPAADR